MTQLFRRVMEFILIWEGGYSNDPNDPGKETKYGISKASHPELDIKNLTKEQALKVYHDEYWGAIHGDDYPYPEALAIMDFSVHSGVGFALGVWDDSEDVFDYLLKRQEFLVSLGHLFSNYGRGWMRRVNAIQRIVQQEVTPFDVGLILIYLGDRHLEFVPSAVSLGRTHEGRRKFMARLGE